MLYQSINNGDIMIDGDVVLSGGLETALYLALFGGNVDDDGLKDNPKSWWGNIGEPPARQYRSETQHLLATLPATSGNLLRLRDAAKRDLAFFLDEKIASSVEVAVSIPKLNHIFFAIEIEADGEKSSFNYTENWGV